MEAQIRIIALFVATLTICGMVYRWIHTRQWLCSVPSLLWSIHVVVMLAYEALGGKSSDIWQTALVLHGAIVQLTYFAYLTYPGAADGK